MDRAQPGARGSTNRNIEFGETPGQYTDGWIVPADDPTLSARRYTSLDEMAFNEFDAAYATDSLTVTIDPGEAFVDGWLARDVATDIELDGNTAGQTVVIGWDPDAIYDNQQHDVRDQADKAIVAFKSNVDPTHPVIEVWMFETDADGVVTATDNRGIGPEVDTALGPQALVEHPDRKQAAELGDGDSHEIPVIVPDGATLEVYRWGSYDADGLTAPTGLDVELVDGNDTVQKAANTVDKQDTDAPVASHENTSGSDQAFILRCKNDAGNPIGDGDDERGVGMHFGYQVV